MIVGVISGGEPFFLPPYFIIYSFISYYIAASFSSLPSLHHEIRPSQELQLWLLGPSGAEAELECLFVALIAGAGFCII